MNQVDEKLKRALRRRNPSTGFADRLLARMAVDGIDMTLRIERPKWSWPTLRWAAIVIVIAVTVTEISYRVHVHRSQEAEARIAKQQVMLALRITGAKLRIARDKVKAVGWEQTTPGDTL